MTVTVYVCVVSDAEEGIDQVMGAFFTREDAAEAASRFEKEFRELRERWHIDGCDCRVNEWVGCSLRYSTAAREERLAFHERWGITPTDGSGLRVIEIEVDRKWWEAPP